MSLTATNIDQLSINTIRTLSMDAVEAAKSGHPGTPMALAPVAYSLWTQVLRYDPEDPNWMNRDRFILSCGHASMLLYSTLHLARVKQFDHDGKPTGELACPLEDIEKFRQLHSRCPGHPENFETSGVETTTGPLGQGVGNSVGMAITSRWLAARYNQPGFDLFNFNVFALCSDGDMMEGVSHEAASIAGHLKLSNLCWIYDDNKITIEGHTDIAFDENVGMRFKAYGWNVIHVDDANDLTALTKAYKKFLRTKTGPTMIVLKSHIGYGAPNKQDSHEAHGAPLGPDEVRGAKAFYGWPEDSKFMVPEEVVQHYQANVGERGGKLHKAWERKYKQYSKEFPELHKQLETLRERGVPEDIESALPTFPADAKGMASRISSGKVLNALAPKLPWLIGGSADLAPSTMTHMNDPEAGDFGPNNYAGRNFHFGIREHGMASALNGMVVNGIRAFGATFFVFTDYARPAMRLAALQKLPVLYVMTHDSIGLGEDGPTHQPIEHLASLRAMPNMMVMRPGDANEVSEAYRVWLREKHAPMTLVLSRQNLPTLDRTKFASAEGTAKGAYVLVDAKEGEPQVILMATGSELAITTEAYEKLASQGVAARLVSVPCWELFDKQDQEYRDSVLPPSCTARVAVEAGVVNGWEKYLGPKGQFVGMSTYGASAPAPALMKFFGFTVDNVIEHANKAMQ